MTSVEELKELLHKNKLRLSTELKESKEVVQLIKKASHTSLDDQEKEKIKTQLLDIFKAIPALTIFLLPGGALLLPILIKLIPDILPSAFREDISVNKDDLVVPSTGLEPDIEISESIGNYGVLGTIQEPMLAAALLAIQNSGRFQTVTQGVSPVLDTNSFIPYIQDMYID